jgi:hypothetical protein
MAGTAGLYSLGGQPFISNYGTRNTFLGSNAGNLTLTVGSATDNTFVGSFAGNAVTTGNQNTFVGSSAGSLVTTSSGNTALGFQALSASNQASCTAIGYNALAALNTGSACTALGYSAFAAGQGIDDVYIGADAGGTATSSRSCVCIGYQAGLNMNTGTAGGNGRNIAIGTQAMGFSAGITGAQNTVVGFQGMASLTSGATNSCYGANSGGNITTGTDNCIFGYFAGEQLVTGNENTILGRQAGFNYTGAETGNILLGYNVLGTLGENTTTRIGVQGTQTKCVIAGIRGVTTGNADAIAVLVDSAGQLGTVSSSLRYKENIDDMDDASDALYKLRPVVFNYKADETKRMQYGLIAEEVEEAMPRLVVYNEDGAPESVKYHDISVLLLNEIQKLNARISDLESCRIPRKRHMSTCKECNL